MKLVPYTKEETARIKKEWPLLDRKGRDALAEEMGRSYIVISQKYSYEKLKLKNKRKKRREDKKDIQAPATISVSHIQKPAIVNSIVRIGNALVEIPSKQFSVDGVKVEW